MYMRMMPAALLFVASAPAMALEPPCAPFDDYDEYLHYEVSYLVFGIGTLEMFYEERNKARIVLGIDARAIENMYELREWIETKAVNSLLQPQLVKYSAFVSVLAQLEHFWG